MLNISKSWFFLLLCFYLTLPAYAEEAAQNSEDDNEMALPATPSGDSASDAAPDVLAERQRIFQILKTEVEPNLVKGDIDKLQRNVKSLGSYRREWVEKARDTLVANPALSELYLYRFAPLKNRRLNAEILATLLEFSNYRVPRAALAFANDLARTPQEKVAILRLFEKVVNQDAHLGADVVQMVSSSWGQDIPLDERLRLASAICGRLNPAQMQSVLNVWIQSASTFWEKVMAEEVRACLRGS